MDIVATPMVSMSTKSNFFILVFDFITNITSQQMFYTRSATKTGTATGTNSGTITVSCSFLWAVTYSL